MSHAAPAYRSDFPCPPAGGDQQCAAVGAGVISPGLCELTIGTAGNSVAYLAEPTRVNGRMLSRTVHANA
jgi:xylulokinase